MDLPKLDHLTKAVGLQRKDDELPVNLINRADISNLPIEYQQALNAEQFLSFDSSIGDSDKTLIFAAIDAVYLLPVLEEWFGDGKFKTCPEVFFQPYTVHVRPNQQVTPCINVFLPQYKPKCI